MPVIHIVDDDKDFRVAVTRLLEASGYEVCSYESGEEFLKAERSIVPGCVLLDVNMPGLSGLDLQGLLASREPRLPIIFLTGHGDIPMSVRAIKAGAVDFLTKPVQRESLLGAIEAALAHEVTARATGEQLRALRVRFQALTPRQRQVFEEVTSGKPNKQIAIELGTVERTIKAHRARVMKKMEVRSVAELARVAEQLQVQTRLDGLRSVSKVQRLEG